MFCINQFYRINVQAFDRVVCPWLYLLYELAAFPRFNCNSPFLPLAKRVVSTDVIVFKVVVDSPLDKLAAIFQMH